MVGGGGGGGGDVRCVIQYCYIWGKGRSKYGVCVLMCVNRSVAFIILFRPHPRVCVCMCECVCECVCVCVRERGGF